MIGICIRIETDEHPIIHLLRWTSCMRLPMGCFMVFLYVSCEFHVWYCCFWMFLTWYLQQLWQTLCCFSRATCLEDCFFPCRSRFGARHPHPPPIVVWVAKHGRGYHIRHTGGGPERLYTVCHTGSISMYIRISYHLSFLISYIVNLFDCMCPNLLQLFYPLCTTGLGFIIDLFCANVCKGGGSASSFWSDTFGRNNPGYQGPDTRTT